MVAYQSIPVKDYPSLPDFLIVNEINFLMGVTTLDYYMPEMEWGGCTWAVCMSIMTSFGLVPNMTVVNGDSSSFFFGRLINVVILQKFGLALKRLYLGESGCQRCLTVINVTYRSHVTMFFFKHISTNIETSLY